MAEVVVVGAGLGGLSTAARLAKLGHQVVVCERGDAPGGLLRRVRHDGFEWDATPMQVAVPAVLRDLFRTSGRPLERYVDLALSSPARRHVFPDGSVVDLPTGSRAAQQEAVGAALGSSAGAAWTSFVDEQAEVWDLLRSLVLDPPDGVTRFTDRETVKALRARQSLGRLLRKAFRDERLRMLAAYPASRVGRAPQAEPAFRAVEAYVERTFGVWRSPGGSADLSAALLTRMRERSVQIRLRSPVVALTSKGHTVTGVVLADGQPLAADLVVAAVPPAQVFGSLLAAGAASPAGAASLLSPPRVVAPRSVTHLGLRADAPTLPPEVVLHGDPPVMLFTRERAPEGYQAWTAVSHGVRPDDLLDAMAHRGVDVRAAVATRLDTSDLAGERAVLGGRSSYPLGWEGPRVAAARATLARPLAGLYCLGTGLVLGSSVPYVAWQAAHVAAQVGKAT